MRGSRRRFIRRAVALGWFVGMTLGGVFAGTAWLPGIVHRAQEVVDPETFSKVVRGTAIGLAIGAALLMTGWSWRQLRGGGFARFFAAFKRRDE